MLNRLSHRQIPVGLRYLILNAMYQQYPGKSLDFYSRKLDRNKLPFNGSDTVEGYIWWSDMEEQLLNGSLPVNYYKYYPYSLRTNATHPQVVYTIIGERLEKLSYQHFPAMVKKVDDKNFIIIEPSNEGNNHFKRSLSPLPGTTQFRTATKIEVEIFNRIKNNGGRK